MILWCNKRIIYHYINLIPKIKLEKSKIFFSSFNPFPINHFVTKFHFDTTQCTYIPQFLFTRRPSTMKLL